MERDTDAPLALPEWLDAEELTRLRDLATAMADDAARLVVTERPRSLGVEATKSSEVDVVTVMDRRSEELLRARIAAARPDDAILGEEDGASAGTSGLTWVIDPIDGTVNYLYEIPAYAVSVAAVVGDPTVDGVWRPVAGAVVNPVTGERYRAWLGGGSWRGVDDEEPRRLQVGEVTLSDAVRAKLPVDGAEDAEIVAFRSPESADEHVALVIGTPNGRSPVVRLPHCRSPSR